MEQGVLSGVVSWLAATTFMVSTVGAVLYQRELRAVAAGVRRRVAPPPPSPPQPVGRPIENIARDARRLGARFRDTPPGISFAKFEGLRRAYDGVLAEGCRALGIEDLLSDLPAGTERDAERLRVEYLLDQAGWGFPGAA